MSSDGGRLDSIVTRLWKRIHIASMIFTKSFKKYREMLVLHGKNINDIPDEIDHNYIKIHNKKLEITNGILVVVFFE